MQINGADNSQFNGFLEGLLPAKPNNSAANEDLQADSLLSTDYASLISEAIQASVEDSTVLERAGELLSSGRLDSPQAARTAAENILKSGI